MHLTPMALGVFKREVHTPVSSVAPGTIGDRRLKPEDRGVLNSEKEEGKVSTMVSCFVHNSGV